MDDNDQIEQGKQYRFRQNIGGKHGGIGRNPDLDDRLVTVVIPNCPVSNVHMVRFDDGVKIYALNRELHKI